MDSKLSRAELVIVIAGALALIGSFLDWFSYGRYGANAWEGNGIPSAMFPTYTWVAIAGVLMALAVVLPKYTNVTLPATVMSFTWVQIHLVLGFIAALLTVSYLLAGDEFAIGFFLSLIAGIGLLVGAVMLNQEPASSPPPL